MADPRVESLTLSSCVINGVVYPRIYLNGLRRVDFIAPGDYYILERFIVPKSDSELVSNARNAVERQVPGYAMADPSDPNVINMSTIYAMSNYNLSEVYSRINVAYWFRNFVTSIIDNTVNTTTNFVIYRVIHCYDGEEFATRYVMGIDEVKFIEEVSEEIIRNFEVISVPTISSGQGSMVRSSLYSSSRVVKGIPFDIYTPRYRGPIEKIVVGKTETSLSALYSFFSNKADSIHESIETNRGVLNSVNRDILEQFIRMR